MVARKKKTDAEPVDAPAAVLYGTDCTCHGPRLFDTVEDRDAQVGLMVCTQRRWTAQVDQ